jgi:hypothetical protein
MSEILNKKYWEGSKKAFFQLNITWIG